jgi:uncharacterized protein with gpF-like domain
MTKPSQRWQQQERKRKAYYPKVLKLVRKALTEQIAPVLNAIEQGSNGADFVNSQPISAMMEGIYTLVGPAFAKDTYSSLTEQKGYAPGMQYKNAEVLEPIWVQYMRNYAQQQAARRITGITNTTLKLVQGVLENASAEGLSVQETARALRKQWGIISRSRARIIAQTELISASNAGSLAGANSTGLMLNKVWISTSDQRTRDDHRAVNGQKRLKHEHFTVGGENLMYPGDISASGKQTVSCRCTLYYEPI